MHVAAVFSKAPSLPLQPIQGVQIHGYWVAYWTPQIDGPDMLVTRLCLGLTSKGVAPFLQPTVMKQTMLITEAERPEAKSQHASPLVSYRM